MLPPRDNPLRSLLHSFGYAGRGLLLCLREERNLRVHLCAACWVIWLGVVCGLAKGEWAALAVSCGAVISCELFNTSVEAVTNLLSPQYSVLARRAKDIAAAGVLTGAAFAVVTGVIVFWDRLPPLLAWLHSLAAHPLRAAAVLFMLLLTAGFIFYYPNLFATGDATGEENNKNNAG